jgi:hypothetical protein
MHDRTSNFCPIIVMQRQSTLQFWDDYHADHPEQEWISKPSDAVLQMIFEQYHCDDVVAEDAQRLNLLEIGSGTSSLVRDVKEFFENQYQKQRKNDRKVYACGTDVSPVCIDNLRKRDRDHIVRHNGRLDYEVLNIVEGYPSHQNWHLILDKGCLDTFLFRSRQRGPNSDYNDLVRRILDNIHSWLNPQTGKYIFISPRTKIKAVRDFQGFSSVQRFVMPSSSMSTLEGNKNGSCERRVSGYLFVCTRNNDYHPGVSDPFRQLRKQILPSDNDKCLGCGMTFQELRHDEPVEGRGAAFWTRRWTGHSRHCKGETKVND